MLRIGVLAPSEIAFRRFVPAILKSDKFEYAGVACATNNEWNDSSNDASVIASEMEKAKKFQDSFGADIYLGYYAMIQDPDIDAIYVPLPPGLHYKWGSEVIKAKKHLLLEKPFTDSYIYTSDLIELAEKNNVAVQENFAFVYHKQVDKILDLISNKEIGEIRLIKTSFGFPYRGETDFRYHKALGGGSLLDCGGYPIRLASLILGESTQVKTASLCEAKGHDVDVFGSATLENEDGLTAQISFGMDNSYKCELEVWGSKGVVNTSRVFTPTAEMTTIVDVKTDDINKINIEPDDQFLNSLEYFADCIVDIGLREKRCKEIVLQAKLMNDVRGLSV